jgi:hypothetical protein
MATKANLISAVNGFITAIVNITKHRNSMLEVINELYPTPVYENVTDPSDEIYTTQTNVNISYQIQIVKQGRTVRVSGIYSYIGQSTLPIGTKIFDFKENEFKGDSNSYLGVNIKYAPFGLQSTTVIAPSSNTEFSITFSSNS